MTTHTWDRAGLGRALRDLGAGLASYNVWLMLAWMEVRQRYRRSVLGPFWLTISTGALIGVMGPLYGILFDQKFSSYLPHLAVGLVLWQFMSNVINDACYAFIHAEGLIKQTRLPLSVHVLRVVGKNLIIFAHNAPIIVAVVIFFPPGLGWGLLTVPLGIAMITLNSIWAGLLVGIFCARFRDIPQIVQNLVQVAFFLTPVLWKPENLDRYRWAADLNPLHHFLDIVRAPLVGGAVPVDSWLVVLAATAAGFALTLTLFAPLRGRIAYWV